MKTSGKTSIQPYYPFLQLSSTHRKLFCNNLLQLKYKIDWSIYRLVFWLLVKSWRGSKSSSTFEQKQRNLLLSSTEIWQGKQIEICKDQASKNKLYQILLSFSVHIFELSLLMRRCQIVVIYCTQNRVSPFQGRTICKWSTKILRDNWIGPVCSLSK